MNILLRGIVAGIACLAVAPVPSGQALAWGAIAVGSSGDLAKDGFAFGGSINLPTEQAASNQALDTCHKYQGAPNMAAICRVINTFRGECYSLAFDPKPGTPGTGWAIGPNQATAQARAMANCQATAGADRRQYCATEQTYCDTHD